MNTFPDLVDFFAKLLLNNDIGARRALGIEEGALYTVVCCNGSGRYDEGGNTNQLPSGSMAADGGTGREQTKRMLPLDWVECGPLKEWYVSKRELCPFVVPARAILCAEYEKVLKVAQQYGDIGSLRRFVKRACLSFAKAAGEGPVGIVDRVARQEAAFASVGVDASLGRLLLSEAPANIVRDVCAKSSACIKNEVRERENAYKQACVMVKNAEAYLGTLK